MNAPAPPKPAAPTSTIPRAAPPRISSAALLAGAVELLIEHRGEVYRLRRTAQDKLILTK